MTDILQNSLNEEINKRFNLTLPISESTNANNGWSCITYATQDFDSLAEFMYTFHLKLNNPKPPVYFDPSAQWVYIRLPKLKLRWKDDNRVKQAKIGVRYYNIVAVCWKDNTIILPINNGSCIIAPTFPVPEDQQVETVLIPCGGMDITLTDKDPDIRVSGHNFTCKYPLTHYSICFNRQGIYVNRKFRDKTDLIDLSQLPDSYIVVEPKEIILTDINGMSLSIRH